MCKKHFADEKTGVFLIQILTDFFKFWQVYTCKIEKFYEKIRFFEPRFFQHINTLYILPDGLQVQISVANPFPRLIFLPGFLKKIAINYDSKNNLTTSGIIDRILANRAKYADRNAKKEAKEAKVFEAWTKKREEDGINAV